MTSTSEFSTVGCNDAKIGSSWVKPPFFGVSAILLPLAEIEVLDIGESSISDTMVGVGGDHNPASLTLKTP